MSPPRPDDVEALHRRLAGVARQLMLDAHPEVRALAVELGPLRKKVAEVRAAALGRRGRPLLHASGSVLAAEVEHLLGELPKRVARVTSVAPAGPDASDQHRLRRLLDLHRPAWVAAAVADALVARHGAVTVALHADGGWTSATLTGPLGVIGPAQLICLPLGAHLRPLRALTDARGRTSLRTAPGSLVLSLAPRG